jgi:hypothetical protein
LPETFHTEGFYKRESVMLKELLGEPVTALAPAPQTSPSARPPGRRR